MQASRPEKYARERATEKFRIETSFDEPNQVADGFKRRKRQTGKSGFNSSDSVHGKNVSLDFEYLRAKSKVELKRAHVGFF